MFYRKKELTRQNEIQFGKQVSEHTKHMLDFPAIAISIAKWAYMEEKSVAAEIAS